MPDRITHEELMAFLDGELSPEDRARVEAEVERSTELARELAIYRAMKEDFTDLSFQPGELRRSVWDDVNDRLTRPIGWILVAGGAAAWTGYGAYLFATGPSDPVEKLATGAVVIGILILLATVIYEQYRDHLTDPYRDIRR